MKVMEKAPRNNLCLKNITFLLSKGDQTAMMNNFARVFLFFTVILSFLLIDLGASAAYTQGPASETVWNMTDLAVSASSSVSLNLGNATTLESGFAWAFELAFMLLLVLVMIWALVSSSASMLPALPKEEVATDLRLSTVYKKDEINSSRSQFPKIPEFVKV